MNVHPRRALHKSKATTSLLSKAKHDEEKVEEKTTHQTARSRSTEPIPPMDLDVIVIEGVVQALKKVDLAITDIDAEDHENPQLCSEYANEIYNYLLKYEVDETMKRCLLNVGGLISFLFIERICYF